MARGNFPLVVLNRGRISKYGLARVDLDRTRLSAETQTNFMPRVLGSAMLRPGWQHIGISRNSADAVYLPFVFAADDKALLEITDGGLRVWVNDSVVQRSGVSSTFTSGDFSTGSSLTGWTDADDAGSTSYNITGGYLGLVGSRYAYARRRNTLTVASTDTNTEHGIQIVINRGEVSLRIGSSTGGDDYVSERTLKPGVYSFGVTPSSNIYTEFASNTPYTSLVDSIAVEASGDMVVPTPWLEADLDDIRWTQSGDVTFIACEGYQQRRIERHKSDSRSWGVPKYEPPDGPFRNINVTSKRLTPTGRTGDVNLMADGPVFNSSHVGALFRITSVGQETTATITGGDQWSDAIRVTGVDEGRIFTITVFSAGSTTSTIRVQRSIGEEGNWSNVNALSFTASSTTTHDDGLDNQIAFYRIGAGSTDYVGGTHGAQLTYDSGGITGVARISAVTGATIANASVLTPFGSTSASETWYEGDWSGYRGFPTAVTLHEGRLFWAGKAKIWGSVSDAYESFDPDSSGDSGPINRAFGSGPIDKIEWLLPLARLIAGSEGAEISARSNSFEEPLTPTNFNVRDISTQGSAGVPAVKVDRRGFYVQAGDVRLFELAYNADEFDYASRDRTLLCPEIGEPGIVRLAVQRQPDTRIHCVREDGTAGVLVSDPAEDVVCWIDVKSTAASGKIKDVCILPGSIEDQVYYHVEREINGSTVRALEKWALESECRGGSTNKLADSFKAFNSATAATLVTGATHLIGETVVAWGSANGGVDLGSTFVVGSTGSFEIPTASTTVYYGLPYSAEFLSAKLAYAAQGGTALTQPKRVVALGLVLADTHPQGLQYGPSSTRLDNLPRIEGGALQSTSSGIYTAYDERAFPLSGNYDTDSRLYLKASAPRPATILGAVVTIDTKG